MKRYFSGMTAQHAPRPRAARQAAVSLPGTLQTASRMPHCTKLTSILATSANSRSVMMVEVIDENRLARSQRSTGLASQPVRRRPVGRSRGVSAVVAMALALHQRDMRVVPVHEHADAETDGQEYRHDQGDRLDRLASLVQGSVRHRHDVLVADGDRE